MPSCLTEFITYLDLAIAALVLLRAILAVAIVATT